MNITRLTNKIIKPLFSHAFSFEKMLLLRNQNKMLLSQSYFKSSNLINKTVYRFSNDKPENNKQPQNNNEPEKDPKQNKKKSFRDILSSGYLSLKNTINDIYNTKFSTNSLIMLAIFGITLTLAILNSQAQKVTVQRFINLIETKAFKQVVFVQQQIYLSNRFSKKRVQGIANNQVYYVYVSDFKVIYPYVLENKDVTFRNQRRSGYQFILQNTYLAIDSVCIALILKIIISSLGSKTKNPQMRHMEPNSKKFQMTKNVQVKFKDVAGLHEVKREVQQIVDFLKFPQKYTSLGATIPKGVLLTGPPGTGKTLLAKACAGEADVPFYSTSGSDFVQMFVGVGASRVRDLFKSAKQSGKPAIIFIDELDAIGKKRMNKLGGNDQRQSTLNQLLVEMDGFETSNQVIVMGATNRKQILDSALVRPGRFDRQVQVGLPDLKGRFQIFLVHLTPLKLSQKYSKQDYARRLASLTPGFSGAEIANLCNEAAILSARHGKQQVEMIDFQISSERVIGGVERKGFVSLEQKKTVAYHECGHAVVSWFLQGADPLLKVTIIPRSKGALGFAQYFINQNQLQTKQQMLDRVCFILGGRCTEQHFFGQVTTGAYDDLSKAYQLVYAMIAKYGMDSEIGYISYPDVKYTKPYGENIQAVIDQEIRKIIKQCTERTKKMVKQHEDDIKRLAQELLVKETLDVRQIQKILGSRPFPPNKTFQEYLETSQSA